MFEITYWKNQYVTGYDYSFLWGRIHVEYEYSHGVKFNPYIPCLHWQIGGDHVFQKGISWFRRSLAFYVWELKD